MSTRDPDLIIDQSDGVELARTFVDLARSVNEGADIVDVYTMLVDRCVQLLPIDACGILLVDLRGRLRVVGSSSHAAELLDLFQAQNEQGPCLVCCRTGDSVSDESLSTDGEWPLFAALARQHGYGAVYAIPLRAREVVLGALNLFAVSPLLDSQLAVARALADAATIALLQADPEHDVVVMTRQVHVAIESRVTVDQAIGIIAQRFDLPIDDALDRLRTVADESGLHLADVAASVVARDGTEPEALRRPNRT